MYTSHYLASRNLKTILYTGQYYVHLTLLQLQAAFTQYCTRVSTMFNYLALQTTVTQCCTLYTEVSTLYIVHCTLLSSTQP